MLFIDFARCCERLEGLSGRLERIDAIAGVLHTAPAGVGVLPRLDQDELPVFVRFVMGKVFPDWSPLKLGIGPNLIFEAVAYVVGEKKAAVIEKINATGDAGTAIEGLLAAKEQTAFFTEESGILDVYRDFERIATSEGKGSQRERVLTLRKLFANASPLEGRYLSRLMLEELRIGIGEGSVRDAIVRAFGVDAGLVVHAYQAITDLGEVARLASEGNSALEGVSIEIFRPVKMMLAQQGEISAMVKEHGVVAAEYKYDGTRFQFHKKGDVCRIYSRKLEDVTIGLPDVVEHLRSATDHDVILDGEVIAISGGRPMPFQYVIRRFRRKHDVDAAMESIELVPHVFDILLCDGATLIDRPFSERREILESALTKYVAPQVVSDDEGELMRVYQEALAAGHEGILLKAPESLYTPGIRGKMWAKVKPEVDTLDLAVIGAEWGEGKRAHLFGSFLLACQDQGKLLPVGRVATGFSEEMLAEVYEILKDTVISRSGKSVSFEPQVVFEVGYSEVQVSTNYASGYALRFPRFIHLRDDKSVDEIETIDVLRERFLRQSGAA